MDLKKLIALRLIDVITENKTSKITVTQLCDTAGVSRTSFYKHFKDVYEVIEFLKFATFAFVVASLTRPS